MYQLLRRALFTLEPERAHSVTLAALHFAHRLRILPRARHDLSAAISLMGLHFPNRIGLAAGFDKNGRCIDALGSLGFGFIEVGTVTPVSQPGQAKPRLFRSPGDCALINRMGFPNEGSVACAARLAQREYRGVCGINIGKNAATPMANAIDDYVTCYRAVAPYADYVAVNVSSPNTPDLRHLQRAEYLRPILESLLEQRDELSSRLGRPVPLLVKVSPDLSAEELLPLAQLLIQVSVDGVIATNTTVTRPRSSGGTDGTSSFNAEEGGLSGRPLRPLALRTIRALRSALGANVPIIGVGGICSDADALAALNAGADLIQIYTGLIYRGPMVVREIRSAIHATLDTPPSA